WWVYGFYVTIIIAVGYLLYYEVTDWGPDQIDEYQAELALAEELYGGKEESTDFSNVELLTDADALARGEEIFLGSANQCATCHGQNAQGLVGPNLTDEYWMHGCAPEDIITSIQEGFPSQGMPPYGSTRRIPDDDLVALASYIVSLQGTEPDGAKPRDQARTEKCSESTLSSVDAAE
ncbi:MAG: c-type cytochrome, partial [Cyclonatronaceae bacterium]